MLLIKGANRKLRDNLGRRPIDIAKDCKLASVRKELIAYLSSPSILQKCMI